MTDSQSKNNRAFCRPRLVEEKSLLQKDNTVYAWSASKSRSSTCHAPTHVDPYRTETSARNINSDCARAVRDELAMPRNVVGYRSSGCLRASFVGELRIVGLWAVSGFAPAGGLIDPRASVPEKSMLFGGSVRGWAGGGMAVAVDNFYMGHLLPF